MNGRASDAVSGGEDVVGVDCVFEPFQDVHASGTDALLHELLSQFAHSVVMGDTPSVFHDLISGCVFDLAVGEQRVGQSFNAEAKVDVDGGSCVVDLYVVVCTCVTLADRKGYLFTPCFLH